jgi:hypothetical protein
MNDLEMFNSDVVGALEDFGRGAQGEAAKLSKKVAWLSSAFGKKTNFLVLLKYLITKAPEKALPFQAKIAEIAATLRARDQTSLDEIKEDQYNTLIDALVESEVEIPDDPVVPEHTITNHPAASG